MFNSKYKEEIRELREELYKMKKEQMNFLIKAHEIMKTVLDNDKRKFMYQIRQEDVELVEDGKKYREIRKIIE